MEVMRIELPQGRQATIETMAIMAERVRWAASTEQVRDAAIDLIQGVYCSGPADYVRAVDAFCRRWIMVIDEPDEILICPLKMLDDIKAGRAAGDCDDTSMIAAALLSAIGIQCRFKAISPSREFGHFQHVFVEYRLGEGLPWRTLDVTIAGEPVYDFDWVVQEI